MTSLRLGDIARFPFVEPPDQSHGHRRRPAAWRSSAPSARDRRQRAFPTNGRSGSPRSGSGWPGCHRPATGPDDPGGRAARRRPRRAGHRGRAVAAGPPRAAGRAAAAGRPAARPLHRQDLGLPDLAQPLALHRGAAARAVGQRVPTDVQARAPQLPAGARVAGLRVPAAPGQQGDEHPAGQAGATGRTTPTASTRRCWPGCSATSVCWRSASARQADAAWPARVPRRPQQPVRDLPRQLAQGRKPGVPDGRRARRDRAPLGATERRDPARVGRADRRAPRQAHLLRAALVQEARGRDGLRAGHPVRRPARRGPAGAVRPDRPGAEPRDVHPSRSCLRRVVDPPAVLPGEPPLAGGGRGARAPRPPPRPGGRRAHALRLLRRADRPRGRSAARTSTPGGSRRGGRSPTC